MDIFTGMNGSLKPEDETLIVALQATTPELGQYMEDGRFSPMALESLQVGTDTTHKGEKKSCWLPAVFASSSNVQMCVWLSQCKFQLQHLNPLGFGGPGVFSRHQMQAGNTDIA